MAGLERSEIARWQAAYPRGRKPRNELGRASAGHRRSYRPLRPCCRTRKRDCRHRLRSGRPHPSPDRLGKATGPGGGCKARDCGTLEIKELSAASVVVTAELSASTSWSAVSIPAPSTQTVDRTAKGDRLPIHRHTVLNS